MPHGRGGHTLQEERLSPQVRFLTPPLQQALRYVRSVLPRQVQRKGIADDHVWQHHWLMPLADAPAPGRHVLTVRVTKDNYTGGIWKPVSIVDLAAPIAPELHEAAARCLSVSKAIGMYRLSECYGPHDRQMEKVFWPNLEVFLRYR